MDNRIPGNTNTASKQAQLQERIKIEAVQYTGRTLTVYVRNIGDVNVVIDALYVIDKTGTIIGSSSGVGLTLTPGQVDSGTVSATLNSGETYTVKAVTEKGTEATYTFTYRT
ncbi:hypothetical protein [Thermofilum sp.]|uniref:hypothetical protein n=1 Tax=Thermofilum sp. TaxID=1961369 RepID=UPI00315F106C